MTTKKQLVEAYAGWVESLLKEGFDGYLLTFMFRPIPGSVAAKEREMYGVVERTFRKVLTRTTRRPRTAESDQMPIWLGCTDWPIPKWDKDYFANIAINDGQHVHVIALDPPCSRFRKGGVELGNHIFFDSQKLYFQTEPYLDRIHDRKIEVSPRRVASYVLKAVNSGRTAQDAILVLPRARSELG